MKSKRLIYALKCPITDEIHYIGKTIQGMTKPLQHLSKSHSDKVKAWVGELKELAHAPKIQILENLSSVDDLDSRERYWIRKSVENGDLLLNDCLVSPITISRSLEKLMGSDRGREMEVIGKFVKERRKLTGLSQERFADMTGIALTVVRKIEQGKSNLSLKSLLQTLEMFGCTIGIQKINRD